MLVKAGKDELELTTDRNGVLRLNLLDGPFAEHDAALIGNLLLSVEDFANYEAPQEGRYQKLVTYATRTIDLNIESRSSDWFYFYSGVSLSVRR